MKKFLSFLFLSTIVAFGALNAEGNAFSNVTVKGQVADSLTLESIPYSTLRITTEENQSTIILAVATDEKGNFSFLMKNPGDYHLKVDYMGKKQLHRSFSVGAEKTLDLGKLEMVDDNLLAEVSVTAWKPLVKVDLDKITYSMEDDPEAQTNNVLDMLKKVPLVTVDGDENINLKGSDNFKIYLNGKPSNMISNNPKEVLKSMPANTIKDIQVITDPGAKYDAEGVVGIINIITQSDSSMNGYTATVNAGVDSYGGYNGGTYLMLKYGKIGFTGNYSGYRWKRPESSGNMYRETYDNGNAFSHLRQDLLGKNDGYGQYGSGELSYEVDTLNLINFGFNNYWGNYKSVSNASIGYQNLLPESYEYSNIGTGKNTYGGINLNLDYQRTSKTVKERLLTASYRFSNSPDNSENENNIENQGLTSLPLYIDEGKIIQYTDASTNEHTLQFDYTSPFAKIHVLETGVKYIIRLNESNSDYKKMNAGVWDDSYLPPGREKWITEFRHRSDIVAAYGGYSLKLKKWGLKTGLRYEYTKMDVKYPLESVRNFDVDYSDFVPSFTGTYKINDMQNIRFGYNLRIYRPGIWQLNPYVDNSNPNALSMGNPKLDAVQSHSINVNYGFFNPKFNMNWNLSYNFENNGIERYTNLDDNVTVSTYGNIGEKKRLNLSGYFNWSPSMRFRLVTNFFGEYIDIKSNNEFGWKNSGFSGRAFTGAQYKLPWLDKKTWNVWLHGDFGGGLPRISLQGKSSSFAFHRISLRTNFMQDKLNVRLYASNPFQKTRKFEQEASTDAYYEKSTFNWRMQEFGVSVSFRFGELKSQIKKTARGINNDDAMQGGGGQGGADQGGSPQ